MPYRLLVALVLAFCLVSLGDAQTDSVDVTFTYMSAGSPSRVYVPGEFNNWANNSNGVISPSNTSALMTRDPTTGVWFRIVRLRIGGHIGGEVPGAYQYKFNVDGQSSAWTADPLNPRMYSSYGNSVLYVRDPTIFHFVPNQSNPLVTTSTPTISAYVYPRVGSVVDTLSLSLQIDGMTYAGIGSFYNFVTRQMSFVPLPLPNGNHTAILRAGTNADTVTFITQAGYVQILTQGGYSTRNPQRVISGTVQNPFVDTVRLVRNDIDTTRVPVSNGQYSAIVNLVEGLNSFTALADSSGTLVSSSPVTFTYLVNHAPNAQISFVDNGSTIALQATNSTDPDSNQTATLKFSWSEDPSNPATIGGIDGSTSPVTTVSRPRVEGEYYFGLIATDPDGHSDTTRSYFSLRATPPVDTPTLASVPDWVRKGRLYEMFFKSHTPQGTIDAAIPDLDRIAAMGYNIIWVMPVMRNRDPINNDGGPGYNIVDFYGVAPEYGTNQDFRNFVVRAHELGMKVILDVTPNHTSSSHPFVLDARTFRENSRYWNYYQHQFVPYNGPNFGNLQQDITSDGFVYYGPFSDALLNYNWADVDANQYMIDVYKWWIKEMGVDGYRFDVYWGPYTRANSPNGGEGEMGRPVRSALKHMKPDIYLLGEVAGVGVGTERFYADNSPPGGLESAYDWSLKDLILNTQTFWTQSAASRVNALDARLRNSSSNSGMGFLPGPNSYFMRFLENHDEDRVIYTFGQGVDSATAMRRTMPVSTAVNLAVGMPMVYSGQEVGRGYGISDFDQRRRGVIDWNSGFASTLMPHYQKLAQIRGQFAAFTAQKMVRAQSSVPGVYAYTRPSPGLNGIVVANVDAIPDTATITLTSTGSVPGIEGVTDGVAYITTDLYNGNATRKVVFNSGLASMTVSLPAYGSSVFVLDTVAHTLDLPLLTNVGKGGRETIPTAVTLYQNFPNPFNPSTQIRYELSSQGFVSLEVYDVLGRKVRSLVNGLQLSGAYAASWDGKNDSGVVLSSGVYFYRLVANSRNYTRKMLLLR
jgi:cyclomaltodextrinase